MEQWYTLHSKPNAEYKVASVLQERGFQMFLPEIEVAKPRRRGEKKPFFPCYLFVKADFAEVGLSLIQWTPGLRRVVSFNDRPVPLPAEAIELIQHRLSGIKVKSGQVQHPFQPGDTLRVKEGPFQGLLAIFDGPTTAADRVQVLLDILGQASRTQIPVSYLEKARPESTPPEFKRPRRTRGRQRRINYGAAQAYASGGNAHDFPD